MDENQQSTGQTVVQTPIQPPPDNFPKETRKIRRIFNVSSWIALFTFLPVTVLILISQNTIPGDLFYPLKRSMENVVLAAASTHPATKAAFRTDLTERRFDEAEKLLLARADTTGLNSFIEEMQLTQDAIGSISDENAKKDLTEKLIKKIDEYQSKLVEVQAKSSSSITIAAVIPTSTSVPASNQSTLQPTLKIANKSISVSTPTSQITGSNLSKRTLTATPIVLSRTTPIQEISLAPTNSLEPSPTNAVSVTTIVEPTPTQIEVSPTPFLEDVSSEVEDAIDETQK